MFSPTNCILTMKGENNEKKMFDCELRDSVVSKLSFHWL